MKNVMIVALEEQRLIKDGVMQPGEVLHTFQGWKSRGYTVNKGEKCIAKFPIWKEATNKDGESRIFMKMSCWFSTNQVSALPST